MTRVIKYKDVVLSSRNTTLIRTDAGKKLMNEIGRCIASGGHVEMKTYQDVTDGHERADATLFWREPPHVTFERHRRNNSRAHD